MVRLDPDMPPPSSIPSDTTGNISSETPSQSVLKPKTTIILYTVKSGDTLGKLSDVYDVSIEAIEWANDISRRDALKP
jgi:LysM repeat protein